jgi:hypothetical protein
MAEWKICAMVAGENEEERMRKRGKKKREKM